MRTQPRMTMAWGTTTRSKLARSTDAAMRWTATTEMATTMFDVQPRYFSSVTGMAAGTRKRRTAPKTTTTSSSIATSLIQKKCPPIECHSSVAGSYASSTAAAAAASRTIMERRKRSSTCPVPAYRYVPTAFHSAGSSVMMNDQEHESDYEIDYDNDVMEEQQGIDNEQHTLNTYNDKSHATNDCHDKHWIESLQWRTRHELLDDQMDINGKDQYHDMRSPLIPSSWTRFRNQQQQLQQQRHQPLQQQQPQSNSSFEPLVNAANQQQQEQGQQQQVPSSSSPSTRHCETCTCHQSGHYDDADDLVATLSIMTPIHNNRLEVPLVTLSSSGTASLSCDDQDSTLPPPLPEPSYSVKRRVLPDHLIALRSSDGSGRLLQALVQQTAAPYLALTEHFVNQGDPAYCGVTTLLMVCNAMAVDPHVRWKGGWRYFAHEDVLLWTCCLTTERIRRVGLTLEEFARLAVCQGMRVTLKRPISMLTTATLTTTTATPTATITDEARRNEQQQSLQHYTAARLVSAPAKRSTYQATMRSTSNHTLDEFRNDIVRLLSSPRHDTAHADAAASTTATAAPGILVVSFGRAGLGQTGDGHFSPLAAYHADTDSVLLLDVARFKYPPYWVKVKDLYRAMQLPDTVTKQPRGWFLLYYNDDVKASLSATAAPELTTSTTHAVPCAADHSSVATVHHDHQEQRDATAIVATTQTQSLQMDNNNDASCVALNAWNRTVSSEDRRPAHLVPTLHQAHPCPIHVVKVQHCPSVMTTISRTQKITKNQQKDSRMTLNDATFESVLDRR